MRRYHNNQSRKDDVPIGLVLLLIAGVIVGITIAFTNHFNNTKLEQRDLKISELSHDLEVVKKSESAKTFTIDSLKNLPPDTFFIEKKPIKSFKKDTLKVVNTIDTIN